MLFVGLPIISLIYIVSFIIFYYSKKRVNIFENKYVVTMMIVNVIGLLLELGCYSVLGIFKNQDTFLGMFVLKTYIVYILIFNWLLNSYIFYLTSSKRYGESFDKKKYLLKLLFYTLPFLLFLCSLTYSAQLFYYAEYPKYYTYGFATYSILFSFTFLVPLWVFRCIASLCNRDCTQNSHTYTVMFTIMLCVISGLVTYFIDRSILILTSVQSYVLIIIFLNIENPDVALVKQLDLAKKEADKASKAKTDFLSSMSHEIRTPLNAIVGFSDCVMEADSLDEAKGNAKDIVDASGTLLEIVNGILDISKIEAGKLELSYSSYDSHDTFKELAKLIGPKMREKGLDFSCFIDPNIPPVLYGDVVNIKKIITNLLGNSCKYTDKGYVRYEVNCENNDDYSKLIISVEDSGHGIKNESLKNLFTEFQRLDDYKNSSIEGTGLGLAITKQLIDSMGGKIFVHSVYGTGSKFVVVINQKIDFKNNINIKDKGKNSINLHNKKILIVDDNSLNLKVASKLLEKYKANRITLCNSGFECLEKINNKESFDIILLDDMMPKMSGIDTLKKLRKIKGFNIPVVALTANAITGMKEKYLKDGFDGYLAKPIEKGELIKVLNELLYNEREDGLNSNDFNNYGENVIIPVENEIEKKLEKILDFTYNTSVMDNFDTTTIDIVPVVDLDSNVVAKEDKYGEDYLKKNGVNLKYALDLLGDMEMYNMTLSDFLDEVENKWLMIKKYKDNSDMKNYATEVHSLKSDSKYLGLMKLADIAYQHELKSKDGDVSYVNEHFSELENEYNKIINVIKKYDNSKKMLS